MSGAMKRSSARWRFLMLAGVALLAAVQSDRARAQNPLPGYTSRTWGLSDGLQDQQIQVVAQTPDQYLWLGTSHGLIRFDGSRFVETGSDEVPQLGDYGVSSLYVARDGVLWIGMPGGGVALLEHGKVRVYGQAEGLRNLFVQSVQADDEGTIWAGTDHGLFQLQGGRFVRVGNMGDPSVNAIISDHQGGLWFGGSRLVHFNASGYQAASLPPGVTPLRTKALALDAKGTLWIGTLRGLFRRDAGGRMVAVRSIPWSVRSLLIDADQRVWIGTIGHGLWMRSSDGVLVPVSQAGEHTTVNSIHRMSDGDVWLGTQDGMARLGKTGITLMTLGDATDIQSISADRDGSIWFCSGRLFHVSGAIAEVPPQLRHLPVPIRAAFRDRAGVLWAATAGRGVLRLASNGTTAAFAAKIGTSYVDGFLEASDGTIWIASDSGIAAWHNGWLTSYQAAQGAPHEPVLALAEAPGKALWVGTSRGILFFKDERFSVDPVGARLGAKRVRSLHADAQGGLWIGTEDGLYRWKNGSLVHGFLNNDGSSSPILGILEDNQARIWFATPFSVIRMDKAALDGALDRVGSKGTDANWKAEGTLAKETFNVTRETGAGLNGGVLGQSAADGVGGAWFATSKGPVHIDSTAFSAALPPPPIAIARVVVDGREVQVGSQIDLDPTVRMIELDAATVHLASRTGLRLRWRLEGVENNWKPLPGSHMVFFSRLPSGSYLFQVESSWPGSNAVNTAQIRLVQHVHFYQTVWFLALCLTAAAVALGSFFRIRLHQAMVRQSTIAEERNRIAREMHDTLLQGCIGVSSLLEGMASMDSVARAEGGSLPWRYWRSNFESARAQIKSSIAETRFAIWGLRQKESGQDLVQSVRTLLQQMTAPHRIVHSFTVTGEAVSLTTGAQHELFMAMREALRNSILHSHSQKIAVAIRYGPGAIEVAIEDNGCGYAPNPEARGETEHFGLQGIEERMQAIGGSCRIESQLHHGTSVILRIELQEQERKGK